MKGTARRMLGRGKVTVLAVVVAVVLVAAPAALATDGGSFILGKAANTATKLTGLVREAGTGAALLVNNKNGGPALDLRVGNATTPANNVAPMKVNSTKRVDNLNADMLDGQDSSAFLGANAKASDAELLDGRDSSAFVPTTTYNKTYAFSTNGSGSITGQGPGCDQGDVLLSGGVKLNDAANQEIVHSRPDPGVPSAWFGSVKDDSTGQGAGFEITVLCGDLGTPHTG